MSTEEHDTMVEPAIESLLDRVDSKFTLVTVASTRAREINAYFNRLGDGVGAVVPPQVSSTARKPLSIAFEELAAGKVEWNRFDPDERAAAEEAALAEAEAMTLPTGDEPTLEVIEGGGDDAAGDDAG
jgi:DNA-directed RNA polymerase subunit omega